MTPEEAGEQLARLALAGRKADGTLVLIAPPGWFRLNGYLLPYIRKALIQAGDPGGGRITVQEARG